MNFHEGGVRAARRWKRNGVKQWASAGDRADHGCDLAHVHYHLGNNHNLQQAVMIFGASRTILRMITPSLYLLLLLLISHVLVPTGRSDKVES